MKTGFGDRIYQRYSFVDAFNPNTGWQADDAIGIDVGITLSGAENLRTGNIWKSFMANTEAPGILPWPESSRFDVLMRQNLRVGFSRPVDRRGT
jgi:hypothetical protein